VTPSYNQGQFLEQAILSVLDQGYPNLEYIVIDGGSTDDSVEIIKKHRKHLAYWVSEPDEGQTNAINKGFARSSGQIMNWLNSDDLLLPGALDAVAAAFSRDSAVDFVYGDCDLIDADGKMLIRQRAPEFDRDVMVYGRSVLSQPACFWSRSVWQKLGALDEQYGFCMDMEFWVRAAVTGCVFKLVRRPIAATRLHRAAKTSTIHDRLWQEHRAILNRYELLPFGRHRALNRAAYRALVWTYKIIGACRRLRCRRQFAPLQTRRLLERYQA
jgi:glycosyltransferase involved in cell wall biosynthesis